MADMSQEDLQKMSPDEIMAFQKKNCIFCKIIGGEIPSKKVYEDENFFAILDINPATEGHVLLMPKQHVDRMPQLDVDTIAELGVVSKKISSKVLGAFGSQGTSILIANGVVAGQKSPHFIVHIIPRKEGDNIKLNPELVNIEDKKFDLVKKNIMRAMGLVESKESVVSNSKSSETISNQKTSQKTIDKTTINKTTKDDAIESHKKTITREDLDKISKLFTG